VNNIITGCQLRPFSVAVANQTRRDRVRTAREHRQTDDDETHVLGDRVRPGRHTVQGVRHAQLDGVRVDQHVARVTQVADERHHRLEAAGRRRRH
jgi:hypothetical protein